MQNIKTYLNEFIKNHRLDESYLTYAETHFSQLIASLVQQQQLKNQTITLGINGCQGSGKTTLADYLKTVLTHQYKLKVVSLSLDDFYLSKTARTQLANNIHPLLATRGVPGTHNVPLALKTLVDLNKQGRVAIPHFNKASDDIVCPDHWPIVNSPVDIIIFEGWCLGATPQTDDDLLTAVNKLESEQDQNGVWRHYVNEQLKADYQTLFAEVDTWAMLKAPSFACVYQWRLEQEHKLAHSLNVGQGSETKHTGVMNDAIIQQFVMHFQRITEHLLLNLPERVAFLYILDNNRNVR